MVDVAEVHIWGKFAGAVRWDQVAGLGYFEYAPSFLRDGWDVSPIKMPLAAGSQIYSFPDLRAPRDSANDTFRGLPGLLADALPDKYGNRLVDSWLVQQGRAPGTMNPVEQLCFIGIRGMGALEFHPARHGGSSRSTPFELDSLIETARKMLDERQAFQTNFSEDEQAAMQQMLRIGTSAGGARPKAIIAFHPETQEIRSGQGTVPNGFEHWLLKMDGVHDAQFGESSGWGRVEYAYHLMARDCQIEMTECRLLEENGRAHFMTKRFDRSGNTRHHIATLCGLQHFDFNDMFGYSYEQLFQTMRMLRLTYPEAEQMFRRMVFNVLATNYDDHTKNFSFILPKDDRWQLAPAYDLCFSYAPSNHWVSQQTLSVNGKRQGITREDLLTISKANGLKKGAIIIDEITEVVREWAKYAEQAAVEESLQKRIQENLNAF